MNELYLGLMQNGWSMQAIDEMDLYNYIDLKAYQHKKEYWQGVDAVAAAPI